MLESLLTTVKAEWVALSAAPWAFALTFVLAGVVAFALCRWAYEARLTTAKDRFEAAKDQIGAKEEQLVEYRERLKLVPTPRGPLTRLSHKELQDRTTVFVESLRAWLQTTKAEGFKESMQMMDAGRQDFADENERLRVWRSQSDAMMANFAARMEQYEQLFKVDALLLRDELDSRLPPDLRPAPERYRAAHFYDRPTNPLGVEQVLFDLEKKGKSLR